MSDRELAAELMQQTALAVGAAALVTKKVSAQASDEPAWKKLFPPASAMSGSRPPAPKSTRSSADRDLRCCCSTARRNR